MKNYKILKLGLIGLLLGFAMASCTEPPLETPTPDSGSADFSTYVALGDSYGAGFSDGAWYRDVQEASYPNLIAKSMMEVGLNEFKQPLIPEGNGIGSSGSGKLILVVGPDPEKIPFLPAPTSIDMAGFAPIGGQGPYQNLSVPGARATDLARVGYGSSQGNPFYARFASSQTATQLSEAAAQKPTFFSVWIGGNDVLGYALAGGAGSYITPQGDFDNAVENMVSTLKQANPNVKGVMGNLPNILEAPYFSAIPWDNFELPADKAAALNAGLRANTEATARPLVEAGAKEQVIEGVREGQVKPAVTQGIREGEVEPVVTLKIREEQVRPAVTDTIRQRIIRKLIDSLGVSQQDAVAYAESVITSDSVQIAIDTLTDNQMQTAPVLAAIDSITDIQMQTPTVLAAIDSITNVQMGSAQVLAAIDSVMQTDQVLAGIEQQLELIYSTLPVVKAGRNGFIYQGPPSAASPTGLYQTTAGYKVLLTVLSKSSSPSFLAFPVLGDADILDPDEISEINTAMTGYNATLKRVAEGNDLAFADLIPFIDQVISPSGYYYEGITYTNSFILGNTFSLDGFHLTDRGYALFANEYIKAINAKYNANLSIIDVNQYKGLKFP